MERGRAEVLVSGRAPISWRLRAFFLREVIARPSRLALFASALRLYRTSGLRALAERTPLLRDRVALAPTIAGKEFKRRGVLARPNGAKKYRVGLLTGCIMPLAYGRVHAATVSVLARNGCEVVAPATQVCCGALHGHNGDLPTAIELARHNIDAFLAEDLDAVIVNSAGCGSAMKEYGDLLVEDSDYAERAHRLASRVKDVTEFLVSLPLEPPEAPLDVSVTYQDSCHLAHAQRITGAPRDILRSIPGVRFVELPNADRCCGSAGVYGLTQGEMSIRLIDEKMRDIRETGAEIIATANPGCMTQIEAGLRRHRMKGRVVHVIELLDESYSRSATRV